MAEIKLSHEYYNTGGGKLFIRPIENGALGERVFFGQTEDVSISVEVEKLTHDNSEGCVVYEDISLIKKVTGKLTIDTLEISPAMLTRAYLGVNNSVVTDVDIIGTKASRGFVTITALDEAYEIGVKYLSGIVVTANDDLTTYELDTDYSLSTIKGVTTITAIASGAITALDVVHVTGTNVAYSDVAIEAFIQTILEGELTFEGCSSSGIPYTYVFHRVSLTASGDFGLKSPEEFAKISFEGNLLASDFVEGEGKSKLFKITGLEKL